MANEERFYNNLALWSKFYPKVAVMLPYVDSSRVHDGSLQEYQQWFKGLDLKNKEVLIVYGIGMGYAYEAVKSWLKEIPARTIIFLEDDLAVIRRFLETDVASEFLQDPQVQLHYFDQLEKETPLSELYWNFMTTKMAISAIDSYAKERKERYEELKQKLYYDATLRDALVDEYLRYGASFFRNFYSNLKLLPGAYLGDGLAGKFAGVTAIICGAGPSLNKQITQLGMLTDKALIFAGGSALNALTAGKVRPHLGAGIDPNAEQYVRVKKTEEIDIPYLYRNRLYWKALPCIRGPRLYITGSGGYDISKWFEEQLEIDGVEIEEGFNVVNFCLDIARVWGCNPIIFVGMDLAYTDMHLYAKGVIESSQVTEKQILESEDLDFTALPRHDIFGKPIYTLWKWIAESNWISDFAKEHPELVLVNATEGGIGFPDVPNKPLKDVVEEYLNKTFDLRKRLDDEIKHVSMPQITSERIEELMLEMKESLERSKEHLTVLISESEAKIEQTKVKKAVPDVLQSGLAALSETELSEEIAYHYVLEIFNAVYSKKLNRELQQSQNSADDAAWKQFVRKQEINNKKLSFLRDVAEANLALMNPIEM